MCLLAEERQVTSSLMSSVISALELPPSAPGAGNLSASSDARLSVLVCAKLWAGPM